MDKEKNPAVTVQIENAADRTEHPFHFYESIMSIPYYIKECFSEEMKLSIQNIAKEIQERNASRIFLGGSGTSLNACQIIGKAFEQYLGLPSFTENPFESMLFPPEDLSSGDIVILISHSGNTLVNRQFAEFAKEKGAYIIAFTENPDALILPLVDGYLIGPGGREISIPKSRSYVTTLMIGLMLVFEIRKLRGIDDLLSLAYDLPDLIIETLKSTEDQVKKIVYSWGKMDNYFISGINNNITTSSEFALKLLEMICKPSLAFEIEEFCHGPELCLSEQSATIFFLSGEKGKDRILDAIKASLIMGSKVALITNNNISNWSEGVDLIKVPYTLDIFSPILMILPAQLFAYYSCLEIGVNPDLGGAANPRQKIAANIIHPPGSH